MAENEKNETLEQNAEAMETQESEDQDRLKCSVEVSDSGPWQKKISVKIPRDQIDNALNNEFKDLRQKADVPGFRRGRAPLKLVEKRFGTEVTEQTKLRLLTQAFEQVDEEQDFEILGEPDFDPDSVKLPESGDLTFDYEVEVKPQFELPPLESIRIEKPIFEVTQDRIDDAVNNLCQRYGQITDITDKPARKDDMVNADVTITIEKVDDPLILENQSIRVADGASIESIAVENLAKILTGAKIGQQKKCTGDIPQTHPNESWRGKKADLSIDVKGIKRLTPAKKNELYPILGVTDEKALNRMIEENLENQAESEIRKMMAQQVQQYLNSKINFDLPAGVTARHSARIMQRHYYDQLSMGMPQEQIEQNLETLRTTSSQQASTELKMMFIMERVAEKLEIDVSEAEINGWIARTAARSGRRPEKVRDELHKQGKLDHLAGQIQMEKAIDRILEMAEIVDAPIEKETKPQEKPAPKKKITKKDSDSTRTKAPKKDTDADSETKKKKPAVKTIQKSPQKTVKKSEKKTDETPKRKTPRKTERSQVKRKPPGTDKK